MSEEIDIVSRVGGAILLAEVEWNPKTAKVSKERAMALAAIEALRVPTDAMLKAGDLPGWDDNVTNGLASEVWNAMIDAALKP